jgi:hypothetical protein
MARSSFMPAFKAEIVELRQIALVDRSGRAGLRSDRKLLSRYPFGRTSGQVANELASPRQVNGLSEMHVNESRQVVAEIANRIVRYGEVYDIAYVFAGKPGFCQPGVHDHLVDGVRTVLDDRLD